MVEITNTSFIPKKITPLKKNEGEESISLISFISIIIFVIIVISSAGVFLYKSILENEIEDSAIMLEKEKDNFDIVSIRKLSRLDKRIISAEELLNNHIDLTGFFETLEGITLKNVQFKSLNITVNNKGGADIIMEGVAKDYSTVALQSDAFGEHPFIKNPMFSDLDVDKEGNVVFNFSAFIEKDLISYISYISRTK